MRDFIRSVVTLLSGTLVAQIIAYASRPLLTRLYSPEEFGILGFYLAIVAVATTMAAGKYNDAVLLPESDREARLLVRAAIGLVLLMAVAIWVLTPFRANLGRLLHNQVAAEYLIWVPVSILFLGISWVFDAWLTRKRRFKAIAVGRVAHGVTMAPTQIAAGFGGAGPIGLIGGLLAGQAVHALSYLISGRGAIQLRADSNGTSNLLQVAARYKRFPLFGAPASALNTASVQLPALLLLFFFDAAVLGHYGIGYAALSVPMTVLGGAVAQVFFANAPEARRRGALSALTDDVVIRLVAAGLFPVAAVAVVGPELFRFVFGKEWHTAGVYAQYLAPWTFLVFLSSPLSRLFDILEKQRELLLFNVALLVTRTAALSVGGVAGNDHLAIGLFGAVGAFMWLLHTVWMIRLANASFQSAGRALARFAMIAAPPLILVGVAAMFGSDLLVFLLTILGGAAYYTVLYRTDRKLFVGSHE